MMGCLKDNNRGDFNSFFIRFMTYTSYNTFFTFTFFLPPFFFTCSLPNFTLIKNFPKFENLSVSSSISKREFITSSSLSCATELQTTIVVPEVSSFTFHHFH